MNTSYFSKYGLVMLEEYSCDRYKQEGSHVLWLSSSPKFARHLGASAACMIPAFTVLPA